MPQARTARGNQGLLVAVLLAQIAFGLCSAAAQAGLNRR